MLLVDYREGSKDLIKPLAAMGLPAEEATLDFGDLAFCGRGPQDSDLMIGVEFKQMRECVQSLRSERLQGHQLEGMRGAYDHSYLLIEGEVMFDKGGRLQRRVGRRDAKPLQGAMGIAEYYKRIIGLHLRGGLNPVFTQTRAQTLRWIEALYRTWTDTPWDKHTSHLAIYQAPALVPISETRAALKAWPGLGMKGSLAAERRFGSVRRAANATAKEWADMTVEDEDGDVRRLGDKRAVKLDNFLGGK